MPDSTPTPKAQPAKTSEPAKAPTKRNSPRKPKIKPLVVSRRVFSDFASI